MKKIIGTVLGMGFVCAAHAAIIAGYDFSETMASVEASGATASAMGGVGNAPQIVTTGNGDNTGYAASGTLFGSVAGGYFHVGSHTMTGESLSAAITVGSYISFTITADVAGTLDLTGFSIDKAITTAQSLRVADQWNVLAKVNGDGSGWTAGDALMADATTTHAMDSGAWDSTFVDLSAPIFQGLDSIEFRIYSWGANGADYSNAIGIDQVVVEGVIPEPGTLGLVAVFGGAVLFIRRRMMV